MRRLYDLAKQDVAGFEIYAGKIARLLHDEPDLLASVLACLFHIAAADGILHPAEDKFLATVADRFGIGRSEFLAIRAGFIHDPDSPYSVLGVRPDVSDADSKRATTHLCASTTPTGLPPPEYRQNFARPPTAGLPPSTRPMR